MRKNHKIMALILAGTFGTQVLMFTCDAEAVRICSGLEGVSVVPMKSA